MYLILKSMPGSWGTNDGRGEIFDIQALLGDELSEKERAVKELANVELYKNIPMIKVKARGVPPIPEPPMRTK